VIRHCIGSTIGAVATHGEILLIAGFGVGAGVGIVLALLTSLPRRV
jgi:hypothetical protein